MMRANSAKVKYAGDARTIAFTFLTKAAHQPRTRVTYRHNVLNNMSDELHSTSSSDQSKYQT